MSKVVVFLDKNCGPSQQIKKAFREVSGDFEVEAVYIQADPARVKAQGVKAVPTVQVFDDNDKVIKTLVGYNVKVIDKIKEAIGEV